MRLASTCWLFGAVAILGLSSYSHAQAFNGGNNAAFAPEIDVVQSGAKLDAQATVSADRKYVTITARPQVATLIALREFAFQGPPGIVGMNGNNQNANNGLAPRNRGPLLPALAKPAAPTPVLMREGTFRIDTPEVKPVAPVAGKP